MRCGGSEMRHEAEGCLAQASRKANDVSPRAMLQRRRWWSVLLACEPQHGHLFRGGSLSRAPAPARERVQQKTLEDSPPLTNTPVATSAPAPARLCSTL